MPEISADAVFLIATSHQARERIDKIGKTIYLDGKTKPCDMFVTVVFLGFYVEASLTDLIEQMEETDEMINFYYPKKIPEIVDLGLRKKLAWFYEKHIARKKAGNKDNLLYRTKIDVKLRKKFPMYKEINEFRNKIAHGELDKAIKRFKTNYKDIKDVDLLRTRAKKMTDALSDIARKTHPEVGKNVYYDYALENYMVK